MIPQWQYDLLLRLWNKRAVPELQGDSARLYLRSGKMRTLEIRLTQNWRWTWYVLPLELELPDMTEQEQIRAAVLALM